LQKAQGASSDVAGCRRYEPKVGCFPSEAGLQGNYYQGWQGSGESLREEDRNRVKMLTVEQAENLGRQLEALTCTNPNAADGLFLYVFKGEPQDQEAKYTAHLNECDHCRIALQLYRYQRDVAKGLSQSSNKPD
jgi:hypothetical protein